MKQSASITDVIMTILSHCFPCGTNVKEVLQRRSLLTVRQGEQTHQHSKTFLSHPYCASNGQEQTKCIQRLEDDFQPDRLRSSSIVCQVLARSVNLFIRVLLPVQIFQARKTHLQRQVAAGWSPCASEWVEWLPWLCKALGHTATAGTKVTHCEAGVSLGNRQHGQPEAAAHSKLSFLFCGTVQSLSFPSPTPHSISFLI